MRFASIQNRCAHVPLLSDWKPASFCRLSVWCVVFSVIVFIWLDLLVDRTSFTDSCVILMEKVCFLEENHKQTKFCTFV